MEDDGREWIALLRRHYLHVRSGGQLGETDMEVHVEAAEKAQARIEKMEGELQAVRNLLAILHGDGGHHTNEVGLARSCMDAADKFYKTRTEIDAAESKIREVCNDLISLLD